MNATILTVSSRVPRANEPYYKPWVLANSLAKHGLKAINLANWGRWAGLMTKPRAYREYLRSGKVGTEYVMLVDAWDICFIEPPERCVEEYRAFEPAILFNAEKGCFPRGDLAAEFPDTGTPWRYLNCGFMLGKTPDVLAILEALGLDNIPDDHQLPNGSWVNPNDQGEFQRLWAGGHVKMALDTQCKICQTLSDTGTEEFEWHADGRVQNKLTGTFPLVFHANGGGKNGEAWERIIEPFAP